MSLRRLYEISSPGTDGQHHNQHCVCRGTGQIEIVTHGTTGLNGSTPIQGTKKVPCPYGDLLINKKSDRVDYGPDDDEGWDF